MSLFSGEDHCLVLWNGPASPVLAVVQSMAQTRLTLVGSCTKDINAEVCIVLYSCDDNLACLSTASVDLWVAPDNNIVVRTAESITCAANQ